MEPERVYESLKYQFTDDEKRRLGEKLARATERVFDLTRAKKSAMAGYAAQIQDATEQVADLSGKVTSGYEYRDVECLVRLDAPRPGMKEYFRTDTMEFVRCDPMTEEERQRVIEFPEQK